MKYNAEALLREWNIGPDGDFQAQLMDLAEGAGMTDVQAEELAEELYAVQERMEETRCPAGCEPSSDCWGCWYECE